MVTGREIVMAFLEFWALALLSWGLVSLAALVSGIAQSYLMAVSGFIALIALVLIIGRALGWIGMHIVDLRLTDLAPILAMLLIIAGIMALLLT